MFGGRGRYDSSRRASQIGSFHRTSDNPVRFPQPPPRSTGTQRPMKKAILFIHGLAAKPPEPDFLQLWSHTLVESLKLEHPEMGARLEQTADQVMRSAYWANAVPDHIEDDADYVRAVGERVEQLLDERRAKGRDFHVGGGAHFADFFKRQAATVLDLLVTGLSIKDDVARETLNEVRLYADDQYIADRVRRPLEDALRQAWNEDRDVALLSHSMGTFVAVDVLWRFSHRSEPEYRSYAKRSVSLLVTMGSPLGDPLVQRELLLGERWKKQGTRRFPTNVHTWQNYACLGDIVSHDSTLEDDFHEPMTRLGILSASRDYEGLYNPFLRVKDHPAQAERHNPHSVFGYLAQPKLAKSVAAFLND